MPPAASARRIAFWILGPVALAGALGMVFARNAVHSALCLAGTMLSLGFLYMAQGALFLGFVQIIVYTGAVMMLFLFVLMLVGRDSSDSVVEVLRGQRVGGAAVRRRARGAAGRRGRAGVHRRHAGRASTRAARTGTATSPGIGRLIFTKYLFAFELTSALLITAALGAMVLAYAQTQRARQARPAGDGRGPAARRARRGSPRCPAPACSPRRTRWPCPRCCRTARSRPESLAEIIDRTEVRRHARARAGRRARADRAPPRRPASTGRSRPSAAREQR